MGRRVNHRGWIVIGSIASSDGNYCFDLFEHADGGFGFEHFRADPEDAGRWSDIGGFGGSRFGSLASAAEAAREAVPWSTHPQEWMHLVERPDHFREERGTSA